MAEEKKPEAAKAEEPAKKDKKKPDAKDGKKEEKKPESAGGIKNRVRVAGVILDGSLEIRRALTGIKGVGPQLARSIPNIVEINAKEKLGNLNEQQTNKIEDTLQNLDKHFPPWMLNRQGDTQSGGKRHLTGPDLDMAVRENINQMRRIKSYKGVRHAQNLPVRGQRTRSSFRKGITLGVARKKNQPQSGVKK